MKFLYPKYFLVVFSILGLAAMQLRAHGPASGPLQIQFIENKGQWAEQILFSAALPHTKIWLEKNRFSFWVYDATDMSDLHPNGKAGKIIHGHSFKENFLNANPNTIASGLLPFTQYNNYFLGKDPARWQGNVHLYQQVKYESFYAGIDLLVYSSYDRMKYEFIVEAGAQPGSIQFNYEGVDKVEIRNGNLVISTSVGEILEQKPFAYQVINGEQKEVGCKFRLQNGIVSFQLGKYDATVPLVIDPTLIFSTYTGATADNWGYTATYDEDGNMYLGGYVNEAPPNGTFYPTTVGAFQTTWGGGTGGNSGTGNGIAYACDMGITKFNSDGTNLIYSTYLGGSDNETPHSLIVDGNGNLVIYGVSYSSDYPVSGTAYDNSYNGNGDIVVTKLNSTGTALVGSTYIGGSTTDGINFDPQEFTAGNLKWNYGDQNRGEVIIDNNNNIYVATCTHSSNFPATAGAYQTGLGGAQDGCAFKLNSNCSNLLWCTFLGGSSDDACYSLDIASGNSIYVCGGTMSSNFPTTAGTLHTGYLGGTYDGFVAQINSTGSALTASSFIGTNADDQVYFVKLDANSNVYFVGQTTGGYPVFNAPYSDPGSGQFIHKLNSSLTTSVYSTVFGNGNGQPNISPTAFLVDTCENVYVVGWGNSSGSFGAPIFQNPMNNMPLTGDAFQSGTDGTDFYIIVLSKDMVALQYATYFGGSGAIEHVDGGTSRFDKSGIIYEAVCAGCGGNSLTPTTAGVWSTTNQSSNCNELGFKMEINLFAVSAAALANPSATGCVPLTVNFENNSQNATVYFWDFDDGNTSTLFEPTNTFTDTGTYIIMLIASDPTACIPVDTAYTTVVVYNTTVIADYTYTIQDLCDSIIVTFNATSTGTNTTFNWDFGNGSTATGQNVVYTYTEPGTYTITLIVNDPTACNEFDTVTQIIDFTDVVSAQIGGVPYTGCAPLTVNFTQDGYGGVTFFWDFDDGSTSTLENPLHTFNNSGIFTVMLIVTDPAACNVSDTAYFDVTVLPPAPVAEFTATPSLIQNINVPIHFDNQTINGLYYLWLFGDGDSSTMENPDHLYQVSGTYTPCLIATNDGGCPDTVCHEVRLELIPVVDVPNAWSPNGDGANDILYVKGQDIKILLFQVFNRWGELVFESHNINDGWDGIYKGVPQEMEVYVWKLSATFSTNQTVKKQGNVTLLR